MTWRTLPDIVRQANWSSFYRTSVSALELPVALSVPCEGLRWERPLPGWTLTWLESEPTFQLPGSCSEDCLWCWSADWSARSGLSWSILKTEITSSVSINEGCVYPHSCLPLDESDVRVPVLPARSPRSCTLWSPCHFSPVACQRCCSTLGLLGRRRFTQKENVQDSCYWIWCALIL